MKINVPLLDANQQVPSYAKFLKDICTKKRKTNVLKKVFLATNISELLLGPIAVKCKDPGSPTIACTIGQAELVVHFLTWGQYQLASILSLSTTRLVLLCRQWLDYLDPCT